MTTPDLQAEASSRFKFRTWERLFRFYREPPDETAIRSWLALFDIDDQALAAKVLDNVTVVPEADVHRGYHAALQGLSGWHRQPQRRQGRWYFVGFGKAGESGPHMVRLFREANGMSAERFNDLFCHASDLPDLMLTAEDHVVFIDDISGTGKQACKFWPIIAELIASEAECFLVLTAATSDAEKEIQTKTEMRLVIKDLLGPEKNIFREECQIFTDAEKRKIEQYGRVADPANPRGFGECGLLYVLSHKTPNNTIPILHVNAPRWRGLFPRYLNVAM